MREEILAIIRDACALPEELSSESEWKDISLDSLSFIEVLVSVEQRFGIEFGPEQSDMTGWTNIGDFIEFVEKTVNEGEPNQGSGTV